MPSYSRNYNLYLPSRNDNLDVDTTLSDNFSKIDEELKQVSEDSAQAVVKTAEIEEQMSLIVNRETDSNAESAQARQKEDGTIFPTLRERLNDSDQLIEDNAHIGLDDALWNPPAQPSTAWGVNGVPVERNPEACIENLYEPLRQVDSEYVTRTLLGKDQSNTHNIYRYELTPKHYSKTVMVSAGTHGNEYTAFFALWRFIYHLVHDWKKYPQLAYIRKNVRLIVHPMNNPWSFANQKRQNVNGVDLNRNMDYLWDAINGPDFQAGKTYYKGTAPFSEVESQYLRDSFALFNDSVAYVDFHTIITIQAEHIVFTPRYQPQYRNIFDDTIAQLFKDGNRIVNGTTAMPTISCHAAVTHNMTTANPEWYNGLYGGNRDSIEMTEALKWYGNVLIQACNIPHKTNVIEESSAFTKLLMYDKGATPSTITSSVYNNVNHATYDLLIKRHGVLKASGYVKVTLSEPATVSINPTIYQVYHPELGYDDVKDQKWNEIVQTLEPGTYVIPLNARFHVFPHNYNESGTNRPEKVKFRLRGKTSAGSVRVDSWRVYLDYIPSERGLAYEIIDFTGKETQSEGTDFSIVYPDSSKFGIDPTTD